MKPSFEETVSRAKAAGYKLIHGLESGSLDWWLQEPDGNEPKWIAFHDNGPAHILTDEHRVWENAIAYANLSVRLFPELQPHQIERFEFGTTGKEVDMIPDLVNMSESFPTRDLAINAMARKAMCSGCFWIALSGASDMSDDLLFELIDNENNNVAWRTGQDRIDTKNWFEMVVPVPKNWDFVFEGL